MLPPISADEAALLRAVCLDPWDDLPRLVMADWLEEHGQPERAALIRVECGFARGPAEARAWLAAARMEGALLDFVPRTCGAAARFIGTRDRGWCTEAAFGSWRRYAAAARAGLWARVPIVRVACVGTRGRTRPSAVDPSGRAAWVRRRSRWGPDAMPARVFRRLAGLRSPAAVAVSDGATWFASETGAQEALSRALVDEGRSAAGLPPLAWPAFEDPPA